MYLHQHSLEIAHHRQQEELALAEKAQLIAQVRAKGAHRSVVGMMLRTLRGIPARLAAISIPMPRRRVEDPVTEMP